MLDANVSDHGLVLGEDLDTRGQGRHRRQAGPGRVILLAGVTGAGVEEPGPALLHLSDTHSDGLVLQDGGRDLVLLGVVLLVHQLLHLLPFLLAFLMSGSLCPPQMSFKFLKA